MIDLSSLTSIRASLLFVALLSTSSAHLSFHLPIFVSSLLFLINFLFLCKKMRPENKVIIPEGLQNGDQKVLDQSQITDSNVFDLDLMFCDRVNGESDQKVKFGPGCNTLGPKSCLNLANERIIEDIEIEEHLIEIPLVKQDVELKEDVLEDLIEIDISMGSITHSGSGCEITA